MAREEMTRKQGEYILLFDQQTFNDKTGHGACEALVKIHEDEIKNFFSAMEHNGQTAVCWGQVIPYRILYHGEH
jgi:hypothetical protein